MAAFFCCSTFYPKDTRIIMTTSLMNTYGTRALTLVKGEACRVWDIDGKEYLDALSGIAVCGLGHAHPAIAKAISEQASTLVHTSNLYNLPVQQQAGDDLCAASGMDQVFFSNSGSAPTVITMNGSFHGRTMATISATGNKKVKQGFTPLVEGFVHVPFNDVAAVESLGTNQNIVAILVEPIQGEGGIRVPAEDYLNELRRICDQHDWLLMVDEIQTGNGRTGHHFAHHATGIKPDVLTTAKGLGNGLPVGACLTAGAANNVLQPGNHGLKKHFKTKKR